MGIHDNATVVRTTAQPTAATCLTRAFQSVVAVTYATYSSLTCAQNLTCLARGQLDHAVTSLTRGQLCEVTCGTNQHTALTGTQLNVVNHGTYGDILQGECVTYLGSSVCTAHYGSTYLQSVGSNDIALFTISIVKKCDTSRTVGIILDCLYDCWNTIFLTLEVDETILLLVATADIADSHLTGHVTTAGRLLTTYERLLRY